MSNTTSPFAFPTDPLADNEDRGMTLRDWFAGQALAGWLASFTDDNILNEAGVAKFAYAIADAMLAERAKGGG